MKKSIKIFCTTMALTGAMCFGAVAQASGATQYVQALINNNLKIFYNGSQKQLKNADGSAVYPLTYNGTTYLPVRAISDLLGVPVEYSAEEYAVYLGSDTGTAEKQSVALLDQPITKLDQSGNNYNRTIKNQEDLTIATNDGVAQYDNGLMHEMRLGTLSAKPNFVNYYDVSGYDTLTFDAWSELDSEIVIYDQNGNVYTTLLLDANTVKQFTVKLENSVTQIGIGSKTQQITTEKGITKILDPTLS